MQKRVLKTHGPIWNAQPSSKKRRYEMQAQLKESHEELVTVIRKDVKEAELGKLVQEREALQTSTVPLTLGTCKWTVADLEELQSKFENPFYTQAHVAKQRSFMAEAPPKLQEIVVDELYKGPVHKKGDDVQKPPWLGKVAFNRVAFAKTCWEFRTVAGSRIYKFGFAVISPQTVTFSQVEEEAGPGERGALRQRRRRRPRYPRRRRWTAARERRRTLCAPAPRSGPRATHHQAAASPAPK